MPISVNYFLYLSGTFLAHVLRPNSFHRCSSFTSHCRSFTSLPQKRLRRHAPAFYFPACFQVQLTYFHIHVTFSFRSPPLGLQCEVQKKKIALWRVKCDLWRLLGVALHRGRAQVMDNDGAQSTRARAWLAHGAREFYRWKRFYTITTPLRLLFRGDHTKM